jgi:catechol-2,3-dioxygenase
MARLAEVALFTEDVAALTAFYEGLLGLPPDSRSDSHATFDVGGTTLFIHVAGRGTRRRAERGSRGVRSRPE